MGLLSPKPPHYEALEWESLPLDAKLREVCRAWALQGYGTPLGVYLFYAFKILLYVAGWAFFCSLSPSLGDWSSVGDWWADSVAFEKAVLWSLLFEVLGLGCGSGPLTGRYLPPVGGFLYWLRPGTTKLPLVPQAPLIGGKRRNLLDVLAYASVLGTSLWPLVSAEPSTLQWTAVVLSVAVAGVLDKTIFLAARAEHYWVTAVCFAFSPVPLAGAMAVHAALWFFAGVSKLNHHFPYVVCVMTSNSPTTPFAWLRRRMYRNYPEDLTPSRAAIVSAHMGTALELAVPIVLLAGQGGAVTWVGLGLMVFLHVFITSNVPMGVPLEWNVMVVYGGFVLFGAHSELQLADAGLPVGIFVFCSSVLVPVMGNLWPKRVSFLLSMRYYAGNWPCSVWLFRDGSESKLERLTKSAPGVYDQLGRFYDRSTSVGLVGRVLAFRTMHLHGRSLATLVPRAIEGAGELSRFEWYDGEMVAGAALGWNFGDGHLHAEQLLTSISEQCAFEPGELRCVFIESQPIHRQQLEYRILDSVDGELERGNLAVAQLRALQPWERLTDGP
jgi:hypothetical protein